MLESQRSDATSIKACCSVAYSSEAARFLLGESFHPGGIALTMELAGMLRLDAESRVLDIACGKGTSAFSVAERFGCNVVGIDLSEANVAQSRAGAVARDLSHRVTFQLADAEMLPFESESFDALLCECAFCTFPGKAKAAAEFWRVLRPGGRVGISDLTRVEPLPDLDGLLSWIACIGDAQPLEKYAATLVSAGLEIAASAVRDHCLMEMAEQIRTRLFLAEAMVGLKKLELPGFDIQQAKEFARAAQQAVKDRRLGYALIVGERPLG